MLRWSLLVCIVAAYAAVLPDKLLIGYASWSECDDKIITAVEDGVNVVMWFAINLLSNSSTGEPLITGGPDLECVKNVQQTLKSKNLPTTHIISIGGWNVGGSCVCKLGTLE